MFWAVTCTVGCDASRRVTEKIRHFNSRFVSHIRSTGRKELKFIIFLIMAKKYYIYKYTYILYDEIFGQNQFLKLNVAHF